MKKRVSDSFLGYPCHLWTSGIYFEQLLFFSLFTFLILYLFVIFIAFLWWWNKYIHTYIHTQSFLEHDFYEFDNVYFKKWVYREKGVTIVDMTLNVNDFIDRVCSMFDSLRWHHFIEKPQSQFLNELKENLQLNQCIVLLDCAENYSFIVQNAMQGHHWNNSQATLHPFGVYFKNEKNKQIIL